MRMTWNKRKAFGAWMFLVFVPYGVPHCRCVSDCRLICCSELQQPEITEDYNSSSSVTDFWSSAGWRERVLFLKCCFSCSWCCVFLTHTHLKWKVGLFLSFIYIYIYIRTVKSLTSASSKAKKVHLYHWDVLDNSIKLNNLESLINSWSINNL